MTEPAKQLLPLTVIQREGMDALFRRYLVYRETQTAEGLHLEILLPRVDSHDTRPAYIRMQLEISSEDGLESVSCTPIDSTSILRALLSQEGPLAFAQLIPQSSEIGETCLAWYTWYQAIEQRFLTTWPSRSEKKTNALP